MLPPLKLHSYRRCPFAIRVRMTLEEKKIPYQIIEEDLSALSLELLQLHPEGKVPLLLHAGQVVYESAIITEYLEDAFPTPSLMPTSPQARAQVRLLTYECHQVFKPDLDLYKYEWARLGDSEKAALVSRLSNYLAQLDSRLGQSLFLVSDSLTLADIHLFPFYRQLTRSQPLFAPLPLYRHLNDWLDRITQRPSFERVMRKATG